MNHPYSKVWDDKLKDLLSKHRFTEITQFDAMLGGQRIWIENQPYATMNPVLDGHNTPVEIRPSRYTILRAIKQLNKDRDEALKCAFAE